MWCNDYVEDTISDSVLTSWRPASSCPRLLIQVSVTESVSYCCLSFLFWPLSQGFNFDMTSKKKSEGSMKYTFAGGPWRFPMEKPYFCNETRPVRGRAYVKWAWLLDLTTLYHSSLVLVVGIIDLWQHACTFFFLLGVVSHLKKKKKAGQRWKWRQTCDLQSRWRKFCLRNNSFLPQPYTVMQVIIIMIACINLRLVVIHCSFISSFMTWHIKAWGARYFGYERKLYGGVANGCYVVSFV